MFYIYQLSRMCLPSWVDAIVGYQHSKELKMDYLAGKH